MKIFYLLTIFTSLNINIAYANQLDDCLSQIEHTTVNGSELTSNQAITFCVNSPNDISIQCLNSLDGISINGSELNAEGGVYLCSNIQSLNPVECMREHYIWEVNGINVSIPDAIRACKTQI